MSVSSVLLASSEYPSSLSSDNFRRESETSKIFSKNLRKRLPASEIPDFKSRTYAKTLVRKEPPLSLIDTCVFTEDGLPASVHGTGLKSFSDKDIVHVHKSHSDTVLAEHLQVQTDIPSDDIQVINGKHVLLQQAQRSCVPTACAMLLLDHGKIPDYSSVYLTNLATDKEQQSWLEKGGCKVCKTVLKREYRDFEIIELLQFLLKKNGPGILSIDSKTIGGHAIILDKIMGDQAIIRDPCHGWMISITLSALLEYMGGSFIQILPSHADLLVGYEGLDAIDSGYEADIG